MGRSLSLGGALPLRRASHFLQTLEAALDMREALLEAPEEVMQFRFMLAVVVTVSLVVLPTVSLAVVAVSLAVVVAVSLAVVAVPFTVVPTVSLAVAVASLPVGPLGGVLGTLAFVMIGRGGEAESAEEGEDEQSFHGLVVLVRGRSTGLGAVVQEILEGEAFPYLRPERLVCN